MAQKKRLIMTGGGTAGHVVPNLSLIPELKARGWNMAYIGEREGMEKGLVEGLMPYYGIRTGKLRRYFDWKNLSDPFKVFAGIGDAKRILREYKPQVIFAKGGFVSVPVVLAARLLKIPVVMHESDYTPGLANRLMKGSARYICTTFPETLKMLGEKAVHTGTPIRQELFQGMKARGMSLCGFRDEGLPVLLVTGGSQGAQSINEALWGALSTLTRKFQIIHLCGRGKANDACNSYKNYKQIEYADKEMKDLLAACDMILSRAGANSIYEFLALGKPMLLIPLPKGSSRGDQILNANSFVAQGFAHVLPQEELTPQSLSGALEALWEDHMRIQVNMRSVPHGDAISKIVDQIEACLVRGN